MSRALIFVVKRKLNRLGCACGKHEQLGVGAVLLHAVIGYAVNDVARSGMDVGSTDTSHRPKGFRREVIVAILRLGEFSKRRRANGLFVRLARSAASGSG